MRITNISSSPIADRTSKTKNGSFLFYRLNISHGSHKRISPSTTRKKARVHRFFQTLLPILFTQPLPLHSLVEHHQRLQTPDNNMRFPNFNNHVIFPPAIFYRLSPVTDSPSSFSPPKTSVFGLLTNIHVRLSFLLPSSHVLFFSPRLLTYFRHL